MRVSDSERFDWNAKRQSPQRWYEGRGRTFGDVHDLDALLRSPSFEDGFALDAGSGAFRFDLGPAVHGDDDLHVGAGTSEGEEGGNVRSGGEDDPNFGMIHAVFDDVRSESVVCDRRASVVQSTLCGMKYAQRETRTRE